MKSDTETPAALTRGDGAAARAERCRGGPGRAGAQSDGAGRGSSSIQDPLRGPDPILDAMVELVKFGVIQLVALVEKR